MAHLLSLAAGVLPEFPPEVIVRSAGLAGYRACGIWFDPETWTDATARAVEAELRARQLQALDIEPVWIRPRPAGASGIDDAAKRLIDAGARLGARNVLIVSADADRAATTASFAALCEYAASAGLRAVLEFLMIAEVRTLAEATAIVREVNHPNGGVLIDALHLARCGATPEDVAALPREWLPYAQLCDGPVRLEQPTRETYLTDAVDGRVVAGEGGLPLRELLAALPVEIPLSLEVRSRAYREKYPDPVARARAVREGTEVFLAGG